MTKSEENNCFKMRRQKITVNKAFKLKLTFGLQKFECIFKRKNQYKYAWCLKYKYIFLTQIWFGG